MNTTTQVRAWLRAEIDGTSTVSIPKLVDDAVAIFSEDKAFVRTMMTEMLRPMIYQMARRVVAGTRVVLGDEVVSHEEMQERSAAMLSRFDVWMERAGDRHVRFMDMTKDDLWLAITEREKRGNAELRFAQFEREVYVRLQPGERVRDRFNVQGLIKLEEKFKIAQEGEAA